MTALGSRRWFARYEGTIAPPLERALMLVLGYVAGGLGYLGVNRLVGASGPFHRLGLPLDDRIPFVPAAVFVYVMIYVTPILAAVFLRDRADLYRAFLAFFLNDLICFSIFVLFPVELPRTLTIPATLSGRLLGLVHTIDLPINCFPSHHVSTAFTTWLSVRRTRPGWGALLGVIAWAIALSTLLVKQHYIVDVPAGIAVALTTAWLAFPARAAEGRTRAPAREESEESVPS